jgi:hypothetical protein
MLVAIPAMDESNMARVVDGSQRRNRRRRWAWCKRAAGTLGVILFLEGSAWADTTHEFWPELDTWVRLTDPAQLLFIVSGDRDADSGDKTDGKGGVYLDYRLSDRISLRGGYVFQRNLPASPGGKESSENRLVFDFNYRWQIGEHGQLVDRVRLDLRDMEGETSYRIRNRLRLVEELKLTHVTLSPYAGIEAFYDSRFDTVSRYRTEVGTIVPFSRRFEGDFYLGWQRDTQPQDKKAAAIGVTLTFKF